MYPLLLILMAAASSLLLFMKRLGKEGKVYQTVRSWVWMLAVVWLAFMMGRIGVVMLGVLMSVVGVWELWRVVSVWTWREMAFLVMVVCFGVSWVWLSLTTSSLSVLLFVLFLVQFNDVCQYIMGRGFGDKVFLVKLAPNISPNKTIEGAVFGVLLMTLISIAIGRAMTPFDTLTLVMLCMLLGVCGVLGDLMESAIKRRHHVKDMGQWLSGHGGMLDRIDSLLLSMPLFAILMTVL